MKTVLTILLFISISSFGQLRETIRTSPDGTMKVINYDNMSTNYNERIEIYKNDSLIKRFKPYKYIQYVKGKGLTAYHFSADNTKLYLNHGNLRIYELDIVNNKMKKLFEKQIVVAVRGDSLVLRGITHEGSEHIMGDDHYVYTNGVTKRFYPKSYYSRVKNIYYVDGEVCKTKEEKNIARKMERSDKFYRDL